MNLCSTASAPVVKGKPVAVAEKEETMTSAKKQPWAAIFAKQIETPSPKPAVVAAKQETKKALSFRSAVKSNVSDEENEESEQMEAPEISVMGEFDPELDHSRMGLPMLLKGLGGESAVAQQQPKAAPIAWTRKLPFLINTIQPSPVAVPSATTTTASPTPTPLAAPTPPPSVADNTVNTKKRDWDVTFISRSTSASTTASTQPSIPTTTTPAWTGNNPLIARVKGDSDSPLAKKSKPNEDGVDDAMTGKPRVLDEAERLAAREKQIQLGKESDAYKRYIAAVPLASRTKKHPVSPDAKKTCSKRSWDGQVSKWKKSVYEVCIPNNMFVSEFCSCSIVGFVLAFFLFQLTNLVFISNHVEKIV